jgi:HD-GYP domain-containing protein (c-di-GMP phosphodiesterase class II)
VQEVERIKVDVGNLTLGMYVAELDRPWLGTPFLFQGFPISKDEEIAQLQQCCDYVFVDATQSVGWEPDMRLLRRMDNYLLLEQPADEESQGYQALRFTTQRVNVNAESTHHRPQETGAFITVLRRARESYAQTHDYVLHVMEDVRLGRSIDPAGAKEVVNALVDSIMANESALVWLTMLKHRDEYTSQHSINVCIMSLLFGRHLGLNEHELRELGHGALLHDIGKMKVPLGILNKTDRLTEDEMAELKRHAGYGYDMLKGSRHITERSLDVVRSHHERVDGSGYPRGLRGDEIGYYAMIVSVVDVYDAITSDRVYHMGISPHEALNLMYGWTPYSFLRDLIEAFIKCLGIYPIGSIVELQTGEVGVVMTMNLAQRLRPIITLILDPDKKPYPVHKLLNLASYSDEELPLNITRILQSNAYGIDVSSLVPEGALEQMPVAG